MAQRRSHPALSHPGVPTPEVLDDKAATFGALRRLDPILQIRTRMRELGVSSAELATRMGVSEANVSRLLKGDQNLKIDTLYRLADALDTPLTLAIAPITPFAPTVRAAQFSGTPVPAQESERPVRPSRRHHARRALETVVLNESTDSTAMTGHAQPLRRSALLAQLPVATTVETAIPGLVAARDLPAMTGWLASQPHPGAPGVLQTFKDCLRDGWVDGARAMWTSRRMELMAALLFVWDNPRVHRDPVASYPLESARFLEALTWDPAASAPLTLKALSLVWPRALGRLWAQGRYDRWHDALARSRDSNERAQLVMRNNVWQNVYEDLHAPEAERARAVRALIAAGVPMDPVVVSMAYADQDPVLPVLLEHPSPGLGALRASLLLCQAGIVNRRTTVPRAQREQFEAGMLRWGAEPMVTVTQKDLETLGPERFFSAGYLRVDGPRGHRRQTWQDGDMAPILQTSRATMLHPASREAQAQVFVGAHWRVDDGWDKDQRQAYVIEFEQRVLRSVAGPTPDAQPLPSSRRRL